MRRIISIAANDIVPPPRLILRNLGISENSIPDERIMNLARKALVLLRDISRPRGVLMEISKDDFALIYNSGVENESDAPLHRVYNSSGNLAIFAVTVGEETCRGISRLFDEKEFALGSMLDSAASEAAEIAAQTVESFQRNSLKQTGRWSSAIGIMRFSPGYCGWHIRAQKKLFAALNPQEIGIELNDSYLMKPLKSISGVIVSGRKEIFRFDDSFSFCTDCRTHSCQDRIKAMFDNDDI
jgi:hypothetical protein